MSVETSKGQVFTSTHSWVPSFADPRISGFTPKRICAFQELLRLPANGLELRSEPLACQQQDSWSTYVEPILWFPALRADQRIPGISSL